ncbi:hypothetical protein [Tepidiforma sp.]|nr:hypothetical protein [Tepidiforma sp.]MCX7616684.1 hypothetical protein [Tepidiforma sp.]
MRTIMALPAAVARRAFRIAVVTLVVVSLYLVLDALLLPREGSHESAG